MTVNKEHKELLAHIACQEEMVVELQTKLTAIKAISPDNGGQGEFDKAAFLENYFERFGFETKRRDAADPRAKQGVRPNLAVWLPGGQEPRTWIISHLDVVPEGDPSLWSGDPWILRREGDRLIGRGVNDNHHGMVASIIALKALADLKAPLRGQAGLLFMADEETSSRLGAGYVLQHHSDFFSSSDLIIIPDVGNAQGSFIELAEKSILWLKVEVNGSQAHGSRPDLGANALFASARMMVAVRTVRDRFKSRDERFQPPVSTMEPTAKEQGVSNINTIPGRDVFYIDCRILPGIDVEEVQNTFKETFQTIAEQEGVQVKVTPVQKLQAPAGTDPKAPVVQALTRAIKQVRGLAPETGGVGGGTVAAYFRQKGLAAVVWYTDPGSAHSPDEWTTISDIIKDAQVMGLVMSGI